MSIADPNRVIKAAIELKEKFGTPIIPEPSLPLRAICEPIPTRVPEIMRRRVDIFRR